MVLEDMEQAWKPVHSVNMSFVRSEVNPQFAAIVPPTDVVVVVMFEIELDQVNGTMTVCLPYSTIEPIIGKLRAGFQSDQLEVDQTWIRRLRHRLTESKVEVVVELGKASILGRDFMKLEEGDVIALENDADDEMIISVGGIQKFMGKPGVVKGNSAVKVTRLIPRLGALEKQETEDILAEKAKATSSQ